MAAVVAAIVDVGVSWRRGLVVCVGEKRVASLRTVAPGAVEDVMAWRKAQVRVCRCV